MKISKNKKIYLGLGYGLFVIALLFIYRGIDISGTALPAAVTYRVRNLSALETDWRVATTAQPGDVLEHFALVQLPGDSQINLRDLFIKVSLDEHTAYRAGTLISSSQGINERTSEKIIDSFFGKTGLAIAQLRPGEFIDVKWQTRLNDDTAFNNAPLVETSITVSADNYKPTSAKSLATISSTQARQGLEATANRVFVTQIFGMNPRAIYDDLGGGVLIAGADLAGVKTIRIAQTKEPLVWRLISDDLIEAGLPAKLKAGDFNLEFLDNKNSVLNDRVSFTVLPSFKRATVITATPNILKSGKKQTIVLQGIRLTDNIHLALKNGKIYNLENIKIINDRVLSAEVPGDIAKGEYRLTVDEREQDVKLTVN